MGFRRDEAYRPPAWPESEGNGQMVHMDFAAVDVEAETQRALVLGASLPERQLMPEMEGVTLLDPFGHPFCLIRSWYGHEK